MCRASVEFPIQNKKIRFVVLHDGFGLRGRRMNFDIDNLRIVLELCQSSVKRVLTWWSRSVNNPWLIRPMKIVYLGACW